MMHGSRCDLENRLACQVRPAGHGKAKRKRLFGPFCAYFPMTATTLSISLTFPLNLNLIRLRRDPKSRRKRSSFNRRVGGLAPPLELELGFGTRAGVPAAHHMR